MKYRRIALTDSGGHFEFRNVPPGEYYLITLIVWGYYDASQNRNVVTGAYAYDKVSMDEGKSIGVILTANILRR